MDNLESIARWPFDPEIFYHLDLVPFIDLNFEFDPTEMLAEANNLIQHFVVHRENYQESENGERGWKSLGLRTFNGDPSKTEYHTTYDPNATKDKYKNTSFLNQCPKTLEFLNKITNIDECDRIRFMLLAPGTKILPHRDSQNRDVSLAVNISLNMPEECFFNCDIESDGKKNEFSKIIPFKNNGSLILFNNAKYHRLENNSNTPRIHLIFHGPLKFSDKYILELAYQQNKLASRKELLKKLIIKKSLVGESINQTSPLLKDWVQSGLLNDIFEKIADVIVLISGSSSQIENYQFFVEQITSASLFPIKLKFIHEEQLDTYMNHRNKDSNPFLIICSAGTFVKNIYSFIIEAFSQIREIKKENAIIAGHIIDHHDHRLPFLHEQFVILNWKKWSDEKLTGLECFFSQDIISMPSYLKVDNVHDDYTPLILRADFKSQIQLTGIANWGTKLIKQCLEKNIPILNIKKELRETKTYSYPSVKDHENLHLIKKFISERIESSREDVYFFNNEDLSIAQVKNLYPKNIISVAAGFKTLKIMDQYKITEDAKINYIDFSKNSLQYIQQISKSKTVEELSNKIDSFIKIISPQLYTNDFSKNLVSYTIKKYFNNNHSLFFHYLNRNINSHYQHANIIENPEKLINLVNKDEPFIIWVSNVYYNTHLFHSLKKDDAYLEFIKLVKSISIRTKLKAFIFKNSYTVIFGDVFSNITGLLTDGSQIEISNNPNDFLILE